MEEIQPTTWDVQNHKNLVTKLPFDSAGFLSSMVALAFVPGCQRLKNQLWNMKGIIYLWGGHTNNHSSLWKDSLTQPSFVVVEGFAHSNTIGLQKDEVGGCSL